MGRSRLAGSMATVVARASPAIVNGQLFLRLEDGVACYDLTEAGNKPATASAPAKP